jgi:2-polyprenyl-6-methoxyphenol hydroxylase-like FAD-dependent oxidoreductase
MKYPIKNFEYVNQNGEVLFKLPLEKFKEAFNGKYTYIRRPDLEHILVEKLPKSVKFYYGTYITALEQSDAEVNITFSNKKKESFDLVIGADGAHSGVRKLVWGDESQFSHYLGYAVTAFHIPRCHDLDMSLSIYQEPNRQVGFYPIEKETMDAIYLFRVPKKRIHMKSGYKEYLLKEYEDSKWICRDILNETTEDHITFFDSLEQIRMPHWHTGRVALVGDAAACLTLIAGQGASMAMQESYTLAQKLKDHITYQEAFEAYEQELKPDIEKRQQDAEKFAKEFIPGSTFGVIFQRWFTKIALSPLFIKKTAKYFMGKLF